MAWILCWVTGSCRAEWLCNVIDYDRHEHGLWQCSRRKRLIAGARV